MEEASCAVKEDTITFENSESQDKVESDETFDYPCQPCLSDEKQVESRKFCEECREFLCETCIEFHKKVTLTKKHKLINKEQANTLNKQSITKTKVEHLPKCSFHEGKTVDRYCNDHKKLVCRSCVSIHHVSCTDIISIDEAMIHSRESGEFKSLTDKIKDTRNEFKEYIAKRKSDNIRVLGEFNEALENVEKSKADLVNIIDKLKSFDENKIKNKFSAFSNAISEDIRQCEEIESVLVSSQESVESNSEYDIHTFTLMHNVKGNILSAKSFLSKQTEQSKPESIVYKTSTLVADTLKPFKSLGKLERESRVYKNAQFHSSTTIKSQFGPYPSKMDIDSICMLDDDLLLITDWENNCLRLEQISESRTKQTLTFKEAPFDVCKLQDKQIAVTLLHAHFVKLVTYSTTPILKEIGGFDTVEKCRGIAQFQDLLYVACGGCGTKNEGLGHVRVYTVKGELKKTIVSNSVGEILIKRPWKISVSFFNELYVADHITGLLRIKGNSIEKTKHTKKCHSAAHDEHGYIFVASINENIVYQLEADGAIVTNVLSEEDGLKKPQAIAFDCKKNIIYVASKESTEIQMYSLDYE